jgi:hypothetical protein
MQGNKKKKNRHVNETHKLDGLEFYFPFISHVVCVWAKQRRTFF